MKTNTILQGDSLSKLKELPDKSINMCLTSPPYWALRDYGTAHWKGGDDKCNHSTEHTSPKSTLGGGKTTQNVASFYKDFCKRCGAKRIDKQLGLEKTFDEYINNLCDIFDEVKRVLRDDGSCWVNVGDTYYGSGSGTQYEPSIENSKEVYVAPYSSMKIKQRNKDAPYKAKSLCLIPQRFTIEMVNRGWILRNTIIWYKGNCMPSSVKDRFSVDFEYMFFFSKKKKYYFEQQFEPYSQETINDGRFNPGSSDNHIYNWKADGQDDNLSIKIQRGGFKQGSIEGRNKRAVWKINPKGFKEAHFAVYPEKLCETPIKAGCPKGGIVLDPFFGSGTTGVVALKQSKKFIGIELNPKYIEIANKRLKPHLEQTKLTNIIK